MPPREIVFWCVVLNVLLLIAVAGSASALTSDCWRHVLKSRGVLEYDKTTGKLIWSADARETQTH